VVEHRLEINITKSQVNTSLSPQQFTILELTPIVQWKRSPQADFDQLVVHCAPLEYVHILPTRKDLWQIQGYLFCHYLREP
jgi:hypothetical protein